MCGGSDSKRITEWWCNEDAEKDRERPMTENGRASDKERAKDGSQAVEAEPMADGGRLDEK
jgi:hypothetical protein